MGMLTATLLIFGRFSADQELTAMRASGISLLSAISPILLLSVFLCGLSALVNMEIGPRCRVAYTDLLFRFKVQIASAQLPEGRFIKEIPGFIFYCGENRGGRAAPRDGFQAEGRDQCGHDDPGAARQSGRGCPEQGDQSVALRCQDAHL